MLFGPGAGCVGGRGDIFLVAAPVALVWMRLVRARAMGKAKEQAEVWIREAEGGCERCRDLVPRGLAARGGRRVLSGCGLGRCGGRCGFEGGLVRGEVVNQRGKVVSGRREVESVRGVLERRVEVGKWSRLACLGVDGGS